VGWYLAGGGLALGGLTALIGLIAYRRRHAVPEAVTAIMPRHSDDGPTS
jgi:hypothetical protein